MAVFLLITLTWSAPTAYQPQLAVAVHSEPTTPDNVPVVVEAEGRAQSDRLVLLIVFVAAGLLLAVLALPMAYGKVPPNPWYGFRVKTTLENEAVWYPANAFAGKRLFWVGASSVFAGVVLYFLPILNVGAYASMVGVVVLGGLVVTLVQSFLYLRTLSPTV